MSKGVWRTAVVEWLTDREWGDMDGRPADATLAAD